MNPGDFRTSARRYWPVTVTGLVTTLVAAAAMWLSVPVFYQAQTQLILLNPADIDEAGRQLPTNPLITIGRRSAQVMASAEVTVAESEPFVRSLEEAGVTSEVGVSGGPAGGIVLHLVAIGLDDRVVLQDLDVLKKTLEADLFDRQKALGAPQDQMYRLYQFVEPDDPAALPNDRVRATVLVVGLGVGSTLFVLALLSGAGRRRAGPSVPAGPEDAGLVPARSR